MLAADPTEVRAYIEAGDLVLAYDLLHSTLDAGSDDPQLHYLFVLVLARMGATERAMRAYQDFGLDVRTDTDAQALGARILKDRAFHEEGAESHNMLRAAALAYFRVFERTGDTFPAINACTLFLLAGDTDRSIEFARKIISWDQPDLTNSYYRFAILAEANVILRQFDKAKDALVRARQSHGASVAARAGTIRQLARILDHYCIETDLKDALFGSLQPGSSLHFCGRMFIEKPEIEERLKQDVDAFLVENMIISAFGSLACGGDIVIAERLLAKEIPISIVLASPKASFIETSVKIGGGSWQARFDRCLEAAREVNIVSDLFHAQDPLTFTLASEVAMGMAVGFGQSSNCGLHQLAITDDANSKATVGTDADIASWCDFGRPNTVIEALGISRPVGPTGSADARSCSEHFKRRAVSLLFADFAGFTSINDRDLPELLSEALSTMAGLFDEYATCIVFKNTWGDACFAAFTDTLSAVGAAIELPRRLKLGGFGQAGMELRVSLHHGIVLALDDPVLERPNLFGCEVSRAARIEPITPPGCVYASKQFVNVAMNASDGKLNCHYVGCVPLAKQYGYEQLYLITSD